MSENIFFAAFFFPAAAAVLVFFMKYVSAILQARVRLAQDEAYREIASKATAASAETSTQLAAINATLDKLQARMTGLEKVLKEVE